MLSLADIFPLLDFVPFCTPLAVAAGILGESRGDASGEGSTTLLPMTLARVSTVEKRLRATTALSVLYEAELIAEQFRL